MVRRATYHSDIPTWISHHSDVPCHNLGHILEHGPWSYSLTWNCSQDKIIISIATKELVLETSHDLNLNLYLGIAPRAQSWLRNMLHNIWFLALILNSLASKSVPAGTKLVLFGRYVLNIYVGIVRYIQRKMKTWCAKIYLPTQCTNRQILYDIN